MAKPTAPHKNVEYYDKLIATHPKIERKGAAMPYTSINGNMYSFLSKEGLMGLRLSAKDRMAFLKQFRTKLFENYGAVMHEYVTITPVLLKKTKELEPYLIMSYEYASSLKPKPTQQSATEKKETEKKPEKKSPPKKAAPKKTASKKKPVKKKK